MATGSRVGTTLRQRRERLGITLDRAARDTNVRSRVLETIEMGDFANYPPHGHAIGIISSYARYLELDPHPILEEFDSEYQAYLAASEIATSASRTKSGLGRFGERISSSKSRPSSRDASEPVDRRRRSEDGTQGTSTVNRSLKDEREAENDDRYRTGSVKVVGKRQTGVVRDGRSSSRGSTGRYSSRSRIEEPQTYHAPSGLSSGHYTSVRDRQWREEHPDEPLTRESVEGSSVSTSSRRRSSRTGELGETGSARTRRASGSTRSSQRISTSGSASSNARRRRSSSSSYYASSDSGQSGESPSSSSSNPSYFGVDVEPDENSIKQSRRRRSSRARRHESGSESNEPRADENIFERISRILKSVFSERRTRIIAIALAVIVIGVIIAASVLISTAGNSDSGLIEVQGGAVNDTTTTDDGNAAHKTITTANGNPVTIKIEVASGATSLISITYDGGNPYSGTAVGPFTREFPVTESFSATFGNPDAVTVSENGNPIEVAKNTDGTGSLNINIQAAPNSSSAQISQ